MSRAARPLAWLVVTHLVLAGCAHDPDAPATLAVLGLPGPG